MGGMGGMGGPSPNGRRMNYLRSTMMPMSTYFDIMGSGRGGSGSSSMGNNAARSVASASNSTISSGARDGFMDNFMSAPFLPHNSVQSALEEACDILSCNDDDSVDLPDDFSNIFDE